MNAIHNVFNFKTACAALALLGCSQFAQAAVVVYEDVSFIRGAGEQSESFTITSAGTYSATLTDFKFPNAFSGDFGLMVGTSNEAMGHTFGAGTFTFDATPGTYWASVFGVASQPLNLGLFGVRIEQLTNALPAPVPLPGGLLLLASALVAYVGFGRGGTQVPDRRDEFGGDVVPA